MDLYLSDSIVILRMPFHKGTISDLQRVIRVIKVIKVIRIIIKMNINIHERDVSSPEGSLVTNGEGYQGYQCYLG